MDLESLDLNLPAQVHWMNPSPHQPKGGERQRNFVSIQNAVRFVVEDLTDVPQTTAWIRTDLGDLNLDQIKRL